MIHLARRKLLHYGASLAAAPAIAGLTPYAAAQTVNMDAWSAMLSDKRFTIWLRLIAGGGLEANARAATPYTMFAVTDTGWKKYSQLADSLLDYQDSNGRHADDAFPDSSRIVALVRSHTVRGKHPAVEIMDKRVSMKTIEGTPIEIDGTARPVTISWHSEAGAGNLTAPVIDAPLITINAVIYPIDDIGPTPRMN